MNSYTTGHCSNHKQPGGCKLHNVQCGYPQCDRKLIEQETKMKPSINPTLLERIEVIFKEKIQTKTDRDDIIMVYKDSVYQAIIGLIDQ